MAQINSFQQDVLKLSLAQSEKNMRIPKYIHILAVHDYKKFFIK